MNNIDINFKNLINEIKENDYSEIFNHIKSTYQKLSSFNIASIEIFLAQFGYWGKLNYNNNEFEELTTKDDKGRRMFLAKEFSQQGIDKQTHQFMCRYIANNSKKQGYHPLLIIDGNDDKKVYKINDDKAEFNYALSKENFVTNIENGIDGFDNFDFSEFRKIFDIIKEIVESEKDK